MTWPRRWLRRMLLVTAALGTLFAVSILTLHTRWVGDLARNRILPALDRSVAGHISLGGLRLGLRQIVLTDVKVRTPEGALLASIPRVTARFSLLPLLRGRVELRNLRAEKPRLELVADERGLNLARALRSRRPAAPRKPGDFPRVLRVDRLEIVDGTAHFSSNRGPGVRLERLSMRSQGEYRFDDSSFEGKVHLEGNGVSPLPGPVVLDAHGGASRGGANGSARLSWGESSLALSASRHPDGEMVFDLANAHLAPALGRALAPTYPLHESLGLRGHGTWNKDALVAAARAQVGTGVLNVSGRAMPRAGIANLVGHGRSIDLAALVAGAPSTRLDLDLSADVRGHALDDLSGDLRLSIPPAQVAGQTLGPVRLRLRADDGEYVLDELLAHLPGADVEAVGQATKRRVNLHATLSATDLRALGALGGQLLPPLAGRGKVVLSAIGMRTAPTLTATGTVPHLAVGNSVARGIRLAIRVPNVRVPEGHVFVGARSLRIDDRRLGPLSLNADLGERRVSLAARVGGQLPLALHARGVRLDSIRAVRLQRLTLTVAGHDWQLAHDTQLALERGALVVEDLRLRNGYQLLALDGTISGDRLSVNALARDVALSSLPLRLFAPHVEIAGHISGQASLRDDAQEVSFSLVNGRIGPLRSLVATVEAQHTAGRMRGTVKAHARAGTVSLAFDGPTDWPPAPAAQVRIDLQAERVDLGTALAPLGVPVRGNASASLSLSGSWGHPHMTVWARTLGLMIGGRALGDTTASITAAPRQKTTASAHLGGRAFALDAALETALSPTALMTAPGRQPLIHVPFNLTVKGQHLPASLLAGYAGWSGVTGGQLDTRIHVRGPLRRLSLSIEASGSDLVGRRFPATSIVLQARADEHEETTANLQVMRDGHPLASLQAASGARLFELVDGAALAKRSVRVQARIGPIDFRRADLPGIDELDPPRVLRGRLAGALTISGTLGAPTVEASSQLEDLALDGVVLGRARVDAHYDAGIASATLSVNTGSIGYLELNARLPAKLSYPEILDGLDLRAAPVQMALDAHAFDLQCLVGLSPELRLLTGHIDASARMRGPLSEPQIGGRLEWRNGALGLAGLGVYRNIHLLVHASDEQIVMDDLSATSAGGRLKATARARRQDHSWHVTSETKLHAFPVYLEGQPLAAIDAQMKIRGTASADGVLLTSDIPEAHVRLFDRRRKDVQELRTPADIVVMRNGRPLNQRQAAKLRALQRKNIEPPPKSGTARRKGLPVHIAIDAPRNLWVRGSDVELELGLSQDFVIGLGHELRVSGDVMIRRGSIELLSRRFVLRRGSRLIWSGPPQQPTLDIMANYEVRKADTTILVTVEGSPEAMEISFRSPQHPEYGDTELLTLVATGRLPDQRLGSVATPSSTAASLVGGVVAAQLQKVLQRRLPLDILAIAPGEGLTSTRIEAGTYVSDNVYLAYVGRIGEDPFRRENRNEVQLEYQLSPRWSFQATYGDQRQGSTDVVWTKHY